MTGRSRQGGALLDVNVLIALTWPNHQGHRAARAWFAENSRQGWVTTPFTETGFVRVSCNRRALPTATTPALAVEMLGKLTSRIGHGFWPDAVRRVTGEHVNMATLTGHRQITDAHLVALCLENAGRLVTFDRAMTALAAPDAGLVDVLQGPGG